MGHKGGNEDKLQGVRHPEGHASGRLALLQVLGDLHEARDAREPEEAEGRQEGHAELVGVADLQPARQDRADVEPEPAGFAPLAEREAAVAPGDLGRIPLPDRVRRALVRVAVGGEELHDKVRGEADVQDDHEDPQRAAGHARQRQAEGDGVRASHQEDGDGELPAHDPARGGPPDVGDDDEPREEAARLGLAPDELVLCRLCRPPAPDAGFPQQRRALRLALSHRSEGRPFSHAPGGRRSQCGPHAGLCTCVRGTPQP
mmetsp:Transcript_51249/g.155196  ORF Transcript_51249/g.155196 Transcript_51249/m.155196 type:complete len:259 (-) Transcript_51249:8-784(-)